MRGLLISGVDDGFFPTSYKGMRGKAPLVVTTYSEMKLVDLDIDFVVVDGKDATQKFNRMRRGDIVVLDGVTFGGFNYIIPDRKFIVFYGSRPNTIDVRKALERHFADERKEVILSVLGSLRRIETKWGSVYVYTDLDLSTARVLIERYQTISKYPEPIRVAHVIGRAIGHWHVVC
ncbi:hypothetical protein MetMK1DRAFT_00022710 [Metallosphaera yellowstonensis MK1]|jgi:endonuclease V-like protein UPF0215 family|uniref:UPF0215 protein MetMK1DRAFT_00022710 n=1 Tax=Metallosphaera yellowstonensis MK1 TaxID=671065 RepID=H2C6S8_9CREN|nr:hypothetical protein MetMK1DRAFT_00022710 [Metallosphaera yellowstonensis MK1]